jgi:hypothetical protein
MANLADIRARLAAQENTKSSTFSGDNTVYAHWNIDEGDTATLRFLPDGDTSNPFFWVERAMIKLPFNGIKDGDGKKILVQVPCMEMYGPDETCPVLAEVRPWFKVTGMEDMGRTYWKKRSYLFQGLVHQDPMGEESPPENPIRRFMISPQIFKIIQSSLMDPEMEELPTDYSQGLDLRIVKTSKGGYADYSTSTWSRKETALTEVELGHIEKYKLNVLSDFLPKKPGDVELQIIKEMFEASVDGEAYDPDRWAQYYRPYGMNKPDASVTVSPPPATTTAKVEVLDTVETVDEIPFETVPPAEEKPAATASKAEDILAQIRARQKA